jgi:acetaldehyde dehydrogenase/alcohol dehydrogenase
MALESIRIIFKYLPSSYENGAQDPKAREKVHNAATMAGMAFANAFLGICHSMAHKLGSMFHVPHGLANALLLTHVIRYNATDVPWKQTSFPQYTYPSAKERYARIADYLGLGEPPSTRRSNCSSRPSRSSRPSQDPESLREAGVPEKEFFAKLDELAEKAFDDQCTGANPRYPLISEIKELLVKAYNGTK